MSEYNIYKMADNPECLHAVDRSGQSKKLILNDIEKLFGIKWLEWDISDMQLVKYTIPLSDMIFPNDLNEFLNKLEVRYMGEKYGWGLFSRDYIEKGSVLGVFTGVVTIQGRDKQITAEHVFISDAPDDKFLVVDGTNCGNVTRFLQHLPNTDIIGNYLFDDIVDKTNVAVENVEIAVVELFSASVQTNLFVTSRPIYSNEIIGCAYDRAFWEKGNRPALFRKNGSVIDQRLYKVLSAGDFIPARAAIPIYNTIHHRSE